MKGLFTIPTLILPCVVVIAKMSLPIAQQVELYLMAGDLPDIGCFVSNLLLVFVLIDLSDSVALTLATQTNADGSSGY